MSVRVLIADDHEVVRVGLADLLADELSDATEIARQTFLRSKADLSTPNSVAVTYMLLAILTPRFRSKVFRKSFSVLVFRSERTTP